MREHVALALTLAATAGVVGCSGPTLDGVWRVGDTSFRVGPVPKEWRRVDAPGQAVAFRDDANDVSVLVGARCNVASDDAPLLALTNHLVMGTTERDILSQETVPFDGREAMHTVLRAKLDGVLMTYDLWVTKKDGCVYDLVYIAAPEHEAAGRPAFERFVTGFHTESR
jgi:hypothetical protein